jgi:hypothetical protein
MVKNTDKPPTEDELKAKEKEAIEAAEEIEDKELLDREALEKPKAEEPKEDENTEVDATSDEEGEDKEEEVVETEIEEPVEEPQAEPSKERFKRQFKASSRQNQKVEAKNRVLNKALADAEDVQEPTEDELIQEVSDWDVMSDNERKLAKEAVINRRWRETISQAKNQAKKIEKWNEEVEEYINDPKVLNDKPELEGKENDFIEFATKDENNNVPMNILVSAFLHDYSTTKKVNKGRMFEKGAGGEKERIEPKGDTINLEEAERLRKTDYPKYKEKLIAGKIKIDL